MSTNEQLIQELAVSHRINDKLDDEREALVARIDEWFAERMAWHAKTADMLRDIRAHLTGGAA